MTTYSRSPSLSLRLELIASLLVVSDVEGVVASRELLVVPALHHEGVGLAPHHVDLRYEETVDVPSNAPANMTGDGRVSVVAAGWTDLVIVTVSIEPLTNDLTHLGEEDSVLRLIALDRRNEPRLVTRRSRSGRRRSAILLLLLPLLRSWLASYRTVPLRNSAEVEE